MKARMVDPERLLLLRRFSAQKLRLEAMSGLKLMSTNGNGGVFRLFDRETGA